MPHPIRILLPLAATASAVAALLAWGEAVTLRASRTGIPADRRDPDVVEPGEAVLVLGYPSNPDGTASLIQRWRVRIAVRSTEPRAATFVFTGGRASGAAAANSEAATMADYAVRQLGVPLDNVVLEERSGTTWENIANSIPLLEDAASIKIASNSFHARRARRYLATQSPELARRLRAARDYVPGELAALKPILAGYEGMSSAIRYLRTRAAQRRDTGA